jgi:hypothetical protein
LTPNGPQPSNLYTKAALKANSQVSLVRQRDGGVLFGAQSRRRADGSIAPKSAASGQTAMTAI